GAPLADKVSGSTMGIIGLGRIGKAIAKRAEAFGTKVVYHGRSRQDGVGYPWYASPVEMAKDVDVLVLACPDGKATEKILDRKGLEALGPNGDLVNVSRGSTVGDEAMGEALVKRRLAGAGLDVFVAERKVPEALIMHDNVVLQPHVSSGTHQTSAAMGQLV